MPQSNYTFPDAVARAGAPGSSRAAELARVDSVLNPALFDEDTVTVGGTASDGTYTFQVLGEDVSFVRGSGESNDGIADGLVAAGQAVEALQSRVTFSKGATNVVNVQAKESGVDLGTVETAEPGTGTLAVAQVADGTANVLVPSGVGVKRGASGQLLALPETGDTAADFLGVSTLSDAGIDENTGLAVDEDGYSSGSVVGVARSEDRWVVVEDAVSVGANAFWRVTATGTEQAGAFRSDADGGDAVELTGVTFETSTTGPGLAKINLG